MGDNRKLIAINDANTKRLRHFSNPEEVAQHDKLVALVEHARTAEETSRGENGTR
jgi:hypothetical protein